MPQATAIRIFGARRQKLHLTFLRRPIMNTNVQTFFRPAALLLCGAMIVCGGLSTTARAADDGVPKETVRFADLNISTPEGAKVLYGRIERAARRVCSSPLPDFLSPHQESICTDIAIDKAVKAVNSPALTALRFNVVHLASK
jgi:UrcA family protein